MAHHDSHLSAVTRLFRLMKLNKRDIGNIYLYAILGGLVNLILPLGVQAIINLVNGGVVSTSLWILIAVVTIGTMFAGFLVIMQMSVSDTLQRRIFADISFDFASRLPLLQVESVRREYLPESLNRFFETMTIQKGLPKILIDLTTAVMQIVFGLILLSFYHPLFIFFGLVLLVLLAIIYRLTGQSGMKTSLEESKYKYEVVYWLQEMSRTLQSFKLAGQSPLPLSKTDYHVGHYLDAKKAHFNILRVQYIAVVVFKTLITLVLLSLGAILVIENELNVGQFVAAEIIIILILNSAEKMITGMDVVYDVLTGLEKLGHITDLPLESTKGVNFAEVNTGKGMEVEIRNLYYKFEDAEEPLLKDINLKINPGEKLCIAGYNGSGKTTLVQIISCYLSNFKGTVLYNRIPRNNFSQVSLRQSIGDYSSLEDIFKGTVRENITLGYAHIRFEDMVNVCEELGLMEFISKLPYGFDTPLMPEGKTIPRSIISKLILARSVVNKPHLLAIEEVLANMERTDRLKIAHLLTSKEKAWTLVAVSDDPLLAYHCDRIIVLKDGQIVAEGNYNEIKQSVHYSQVFKIND